MEITATQYKNSDLVSLSGRIDSFTAPQLSEALDKLTDNGRFRIALNMREVDFLSSAGLRVLISTQKKCKKKHGELVLSEVPERVYGAMELAGFVPLFTFFDKDIDAVGHF